MKKNMIKKYITTFLAISFFISAAFPIVYGQSTKTDTDNDQNSEHSKYNGIVYWKQYDPETRKFIKIPLYEKSEDEINKLVEDLTIITNMNGNPTEKILNQLIFLKESGITPPNFNIEQYIELAEYMNNNKVKTKDSATSTNIITPALTTMLAIGRPVVYAWTPRSIIFPPSETEIFKFGNYNFTVYQDSYLSLGTVSLGIGFLLSTNVFQTASILQTGFILITLGFLGIYIDFFVYDTQHQEKPRALAEFMLSVNLATVVIPW